MRWHEIFRRMVSRCWRGVRRKSPATYLKVCAMLVPRELKVEHTGGVKSMTDEELERGIEAIKAMLAAREAGENAKVIEGIAGPGEGAAPAKVPGPPVGLRLSRKKSARLDQWAKAQRLHAVAGHPRADRARPPARPGPARL